MTRRLFCAVTVVLLVLFGTSARGQLSSADHTAFGTGSLTVDAATGLGWLDITLTGTRSFNNMIGADGSNEFAAGGAFAGFRYATFAEVETFWINAGIPQSAFYYGLDSNDLAIGTFSTQNIDVFSSARAFQELVGFEITTLEIFPTIRPGAWNTDGWAVDENGRLLGSPGIQTCTNGTGFCGGQARETRAHLASNIQFDSVSRDVTGSHHWLVTTVTPIPEPEAYAMLLAGLALLGFATRRRERLRAAA